MKKYRMYAKTIKGCNEWFQIVKIKMFADIEKGRF